VNDVERAFEVAVAPLLTQPGVGRGRKPQVCQVNGKIFAMVSLGSFVVKLPRARVDALVAAGKGGHYVLGARTMKEWIALAPGTGADWLALAAEAKELASGG
jgi:hypothetical protein